MKNISTTSQQDKIFSLVYCEQFQNAVKIFKKNNLLPKEGFRAEIFAKQVLEHTDQDLQKAIEILGSVKKLNTNLDTSKIGVTLFSLLAIASFAQMTYNDLSGTSSTLPQRAVEVNSFMSLAGASFCYYLKNSNNKSKIQGIMQKITSSSQNSSNQR